MRRFSVSLLVLNSVCVNVQEQVSTLDIALYIRALSHLTTSIPIIRSSSFQTVGRRNLIARENGFLVNWPFSVLCKTKSCNALKYPTNCAQLRCAPACETKITRLDLFKPRGRTVSSHLPVSLFISISGVTVCSSDVFPWEAGEHLDYAPAFDRCR